MDNIYICNLDVLPFFSRVIKKFHTSFGFWPGLEISFFDKGVIGFSLSFMIYSTKKKAEDKENNKEDQTDMQKTLYNMYNV